jgi:C-terminal processing protease CtpA/Prc
MRTAWLTLAIALFVASSSCSRGQEWADLGFEAGTVGDAPRGWFVPTPGWKAELTEERAAAGSRAVKLFKSGESTAPFGNVMHSGPAAAFASRHVTLTAKILVVGEGRGQMWLRVDREGGGMGAFDNMHDRPILAGDWQDATIEADVEADAATLNIGFMSTGGGATLFIDDVKIKVSGDKWRMQEPSPARTLSLRGAANLAAAAKLLSYVRFFHPSDQAVGVASWDHFAVDLMERCEPAADAEDLANRLSSAFAEIAPTVDIWVGTPKQAPPRHAVPSGASAVAMWRHFGAGSIGSASPRGRYRSTIEKTPLESFPGGLDAAFVVKDLGAGVSCRVPIAVFADDSGTLPHGSTPEAWASKADLPRLSAQNRSTRLAGVAIGWGVFQHFYPYFDVVQTDWEAALPAALVKAAEDTDELAYLLTLREMVAKLYDGHGNVTNTALQARSFLPLAVEWAGNDLAVVGKHASVPDSVSIGDAIVSIDGRPIEDCYDDVSKWISAATDGWRRRVSGRALIADLPTKDPAQLVFRKPDGQTVTVDLARVTDVTPNTATSTRPENGAELAPGVVYFDLSGAETDALTEVMPKLTAPKAIIFDLRGYPGSAGKELMEHLIDEPATSARWRVPIVRRPDRVDLEWQESGRWQLRPQKPRLNAKIAFLADGRAISYAESVMGIVEYYRLGEIVGSTTAGTNGNVNPFMLPGGYIVTWTGMQVLKHDGLQHHGIGIGPTVPVTPTAKGIAEGRDEVLEKAVEVMKAKIAAGSVGQE